MSKNWAICIGINEYYRLPHLQYAVSDAVAMRDFFLKEIKFEEVFYFADDSPPIKTPEGPMRSEPTYANLRYFFRKRFQNQFLSAADNFWFFFAGHGQLQDGHDYLMPIDVDPEDLDKTALKISDITASLRNSGADNTVLLLDACRNQGRRSAGFGSDEQAGVVTMYACSPQKSSYEIAALKQGAFTYALLEGLRLEGANSCATVQRLDQYLRHRVPQLNEQHNMPVQIPYTAVEPLSKNCLILLPQRARLEDVESLKNAAFRAELNDDWEFAKQLWTRVLATGVDPEALEAFGRIALKQSQPLATGNTSVETAGSRRIAESLVESESDVVKAAPSAKPVIEPQPKKLTFGFEVVSVNSTGDITQRQQRSAEYWRESLGQGVDLDLVLIPGGTFMMGSPVEEKDSRDEERPQHKVSVPSFWMGKYPVTQAQWRAVSALPQVERSLTPNPSKFNGSDRPVEKVSWLDAVEFCQRLSKHTGRAYRLPSEAEWEYACRAGTTTPFCFGETLTSALANYDANYTYGDGPKGKYREQITDLGSFPANGFGLCDMHGNVGEWCEDHWHSTYEGAPSDGSAWKTSNDNISRVIRGGSWNDYPRNCRSATRGSVTPDGRLNVIGFRVSCPAPRTL
jgi:formylglycine-generating enzyme required for sulfatase activity/uncharacterized caspase-like protein